jgi:hypothetical protein
VEEGERRKQPPPPPQCASTPTSSAVSVAPDNGNVWELRGGSSGHPVSSRAGKARNVVVYDDIGLRPTARVTPTITANPAAAGHQLVTETVFSTEVHSIRKILEARRSLQKSQQHRQHRVPVVYEAPGSGGGDVVVFDDIGDWLASHRPPTSPVQRQSTPPPPALAGASGSLRAPGGAAKVTPQPMMVPGNRDGLKLELGMPDGSECGMRGEEGEESSGSSSRERLSPVFHRPASDYFKVLLPSAWNHNDPIALNLRGSPDCYFSVSQFFLSPNLKKLENVYSIKSLASL